MHEDLDTPGPAELEQLADNEAGEGRIPNCQHFRRLARKWREDREDRDALRHALLQATTEKARARRAELKPAAERMAYAVALQGDHGITLGPLCKAPACAIQALSPFEGAAVIGLATIAVEAEATSGMQYRLKNAGGAPDQKAVPHTVPVRDAIHGTCEVTKVFPGDVVAAERDLQASAPVGVEGFDAWWKSHSIDPEFPETMDDRTFAKAAWDAALAQQPVAELYRCTACDDHYRVGTPCDCKVQPGHPSHAPGGQQPAAEYADADALIAYLDTLCDQSDEKWDVAQAAIAGIRAAQQSAAEPKLVFGLGEAKALVEFFGGSNTAVVVQHLPAGQSTDDDGKPNPAGLYAWCDECPEEGAAFLGPVDTETQEHDDVQQQLAAADDDAAPAEPCESGLPDCGPAVAWDSDGVGACDRCAKELGWIAGPQQGGTPE